MMVHVPISIKGPHAVYRIYGPGDLVLYIGCSKNPRTRMSGHKHYNKETWWPLVRRHEITWYPNFVEARAAETAELRALRPLCNPVIPEANGKHITITKGLHPKRSTFAQIAAIAADEGITTIEFIERALENYVRRHRGE